VDASNDAGVVKNGDFSVLSVSIDYILGSFRIKANINYLFPIGFPLTQNRWLWMILNGHFMLWRWSFFAFCGRIAVFCCVTYLALYFKFLERDGNRGPWPASVILIGLDWIGLLSLYYQVKLTWFSECRLTAWMSGRIKQLSKIILTAYD